MPELVVMRGLPACGKTTFAKAWVAEDPEHRARINRDDMRAMMRQGWSLGTERSVVACRDAQITALLKRDVSVICDDTNLPQKVARDVAKLGWDVGADVRFEDMTNIGYTTCMDRDAARENPVGEDVILDKYDRYIRGRVYPLPVPVQEQEVIQAYVRPGGPEVIIVDIDGTVALRGYRSPYDETRVGEDTLNVPVVNTVWAMHNEGYGVIYVSGRTDSCEEATRHWLRTQVRIPYRELFMRETGDRRNDTIVKREIFDREIRDRYDVICAFDDRQRVVDMWRSLGLTCLQVAPGNF